MDSSEPRYPSKPMAEPGPTLPKWNSINTPIPDPRRRIANMTGTNPAHLEAAQTLLLFSRTPKTNNSQAQKRSPVLSQPLSKGGQSTTKVEHDQHEEKPPSTIQPGHQGYHTDPSQKLMESFSGPSKPEYSPSVENKRPAQSKFTTDFEPTKHTAEETPVLKDAPVNKDEPTSTSGGAVDSSNDNTFTCLYNELRGQPCSHQAAGKMLTKAYMRKVCSDLFGRNKWQTLHIKDWIPCCRLDYQHGSYVSKSMEQNEPALYKLLLFRSMLEKVEQQQISESPGGQPGSYWITPKKNEMDRLIAYWSNQSGYSHQDIWSEPSRSKVEGGTDFYKARLGDLLHIWETWCGFNKTKEEVIQCVEYIEERLEQNDVSNVTPIEFVPEWKSVPSQASKFNPRTGVPQNGVSFLNWKQKHTSANLEPAPQISKGRRLKRAQESQEQSGFKTGRSDLPYQPAESSNFKGKGKGKAFDVSDEETSSNATPKASKHKMTGAQEPELEGRPLKKQRFESPRQGNFRRNSI